MAKIKTKKRDTFIDMTAMSDVTVLLLTFFMLTANFIPIEPVQVITPASVMETKVPDYNVITVLIEPGGKVYLNFDRPNDKREILEKMGARYDITFSEQEKTNFMEPTTFVGVSIAQLKEYLTLDMEDQKNFLRQTNGVPTDSANNQLSMWIQTAKSVNRDLSISIKADQTTPYPLVRVVTSTLQDIKENRFSLITTLRNMPEGF
ncbi:MAG: biopolymer transporter ExbD [Prevotellaceae bacterium]|jgi:biopolymer transport protein ExbD|nr:biopolymer transporter ExbD [Prevotellaceae bacterium]